MYRIVSIVAQNSKGKTCLLSSISPFATTTSLDERSTLSYILPGKDGYKEIHYENNGDQIIIKHYYKATKDTHSVKSYFSLNGEELNENGNVRSFLSIVETHMGITEELMRLVRLGTNVNSFITLPPARRKEYIGKLIEEIDLYLKIHKAVGEDIRVQKALLQTNSNNIYNCHITDLTVEEENLRSVEKTVKQLEKERDDLIRRIGKLNALIAENNLDELRHKRQDSENSLRELAQMELDIAKQHLVGISVDKLIAKRSDLSEKKINVQSKINSYRLSIDSALRTIEKLEASVKKVASNNDLSALMNAIDSTKSALSSVSNMVKTFTPLGSTSEEVTHLISILQSFNQIAQTIYTFGTKPVSVYLKLKQENRPVDKFLKEQQKKLMSTINKDDLRSLLVQMFGDDMVIEPNCETEFQQCPYYRFADTINSIKDQLEEDTLDGETLRYIQIIARNIDNILNELDYVQVQIPDRCKEGLTEASILSRMGNKLPFFDLSPIQEYNTILREYEIYQQNLAKLKEFEHQLAIYRQSGIDLQMAQIKEQKETIEFYRTNITTLTSEMGSIGEQLKEVDRQIALISRYEERSKMKKILESSLESTDKILKPLENAADELKELNWRSQQITLDIDRNRGDARRLDVKIAEYKRLVKENTELTQKIKELTMIKEAVSTRKGIPVIYMKKYLGRIQKVANNLLKLIYDGELYLDEFYITQDTFEIPYVKNGTRIPDVKYSSQSENALMTMALSFALMNRATGQYNVLLLDEMDAGLDDENRAAFLQMLDAQMRELKAEQVFMISHNMSQMINIPMDCIQLSDTGIKSKLQNVIYP
jgi:hypothetical protein